MKLIIKLINCTSKLTNVKNYQFTHVSRLLKNKSTRYKYHIVKWYHVEPRLFN